MHMISVVTQKDISFLAAETARETLEAEETRPGLRSGDVFNGINSNNNAVRTITRYVHTKHANSPVKIFRETMV